MCTFHTHTYYVKMKALPQDKFMHSIVHRYLVRYSLLMSMVFFISFKIKEFLFCCFLFFFYLVFVLIVILIIRILIVSVLILLGWCCCCFVADFSRSFISSTFYLKKRTKHLVDKYHWSLTSIQLFFVLIAPKILVSACACVLFFVFILKIFYTSSFSVRFVCFWFRFYFSLLCLLQTVANFIGPC